MPYNQKFDYSTQNSKTAHQHYSHTEDNFLLACTVLPNQPSTTCINQLSACTVKLGDAFSSLPALTSDDDSPSTYARISDVPPKEKDATEQYSAVFEATCSVETSCEFADTLAKLYTQPHFHHDGRLYGGVSKGDLQSERKNSDASHGIRIHITCAGPIAGTGGHHWVAPCFCCKT